MATFYAAWDTGQWDHFDNAHDAQVAAARNGGVYFGSDLQTLQAYLSTGLDIQQWVKQNGGGSIPISGGGAPPVGGGFPIPPAGGGGNLGDIGPESMLGTGTGDTGGGSLAQFFGSPTGQALLQTFLSFGSAKALGGKTSEEKALSKAATAPFDSSLIQGFLPAPLRAIFTNPILLQGLARIGDLIRNPGGLPSNVSDAVRPQLAQESANIAENYRNLQSNAAGAAARGNAPVSIKDALSSALDTQEERAQRQARQNALSETASLGRSDVDQTYKLLNSLLQFTSSGRGQAIPGLATAASEAGQRQAANQALAASAIKTIGDLFNRPRTQNASDQTWF